MSRPRTIFFIGRFQPLHNGHMAALKQALSRAPRILIGIGSSQASHQKKNPFSYAERRHMLLLALRGLKVGKNKARIIPIPDVFNDNRWAASILRHPFDEAFSGSRWVKRCLKGKKPVHSPRMFRRLEYRATLVRTRLRDNKKWAHLVPAPVARFLMGIGGPMRIRALYGKN